LSSKHNKVTRDSNNVRLEPLQLAAAELVSELFGEAAGVLAVVELDEPGDPFFLAAGVVGVDSCRFFADDDIVPLHSGD
jgi:hypothetical protein